MSTSPSPTATWNFDTEENCLAWKITDEAIDYTNDNVINRPSHANIDWVIQNFTGTRNLTISNDMKKFLSDAIVGTLNANAANAHK